MFCERHPDAVPVSECCGAERTMTTPDHCADCRELTGFECPECIAQAIPEDSPNV